MSKETTYLSVILKKQPLGEGDEIVTLFTKESGKVRALAKSTKFAKSKLQYGLQVLFLANVAVAGSRGMPRIIGTQVQNAFANIRSNLEAAKRAFFALELVLKFTPDEQPNESLFELLVMFLNFLNSPEISESQLNLGLAQFKIHFLETLGLGVQMPDSTEQIDHVGFSNSRGGFLVNEDAVDYVPVNLETLEQFQVLQESNFGSDYDGQVLQSKIEPLQHLLSAFLAYQLERDIKSEELLGM